MVLTLLSFHSLTSTLDKGEGCHVSKPVEHVSGFVLALQQLKQFSYCVVLLVYIYIYIYISFFNYYLFSTNL